MDSNQVFLNLKTWKKCAISEAIKSIAFRPQRKTEGYLPGSLKTKLHQRQRVEFLFGQN